MAAPGVSGSAAPEVAESLAPPEVAESLAPEVAESAAPGVHAVHILLCKLFHICLYGRITQHKTRDPLKNKIDVLFALRLLSSKARHINITSL